MLDEYSEDAARIIITLGLQPVNASRCAAGLTDFLSKLQLELARDGRWRDEMRCIEKARKLLKESRALGNSRGGVVPPSLTEPILALEEGLKYLIMAGEPPPRKKGRPPSELGQEFKILAFFWEHFEKPRITNATNQGWASKRQEAAYRNKAFEFVKEIVASKRSRGVSLGIIIPNEARTWSKRYATTKGLHDRLYQTIVDLEKVMRGILKSQAE